ncbi:uncharacterized protein LOC127787112 [Diospyros lotus]|uniref:uncharacterized protein LOC127787112 n=1 Tax=Diospyros lotus TaxID=55363 RepID=UPI0022584F9E|nr:uncharacterized protein LOC127787112 [Diospyros lotus]
MGGSREVEIAGEKLVIYEHDDVCDLATGRALTGSWVWDSAFVLSQWTATQGRLEFDFAGKTVLELGAGTGLPGLTAALLGASRVVLTDVEALLPGLTKNVEANGLGDRIWVSRLVWGSDDLPEEVGGVELVIMSDVFFDATDVAVLGRTLKRVCGEKTRVWAACEIRPLTGECLNELVSVGFEVVELASQLGVSSDEFAVFHLVPPTQDGERQ